MSNWLLPWQEIVRFNKLTLDERSVVFYSEDAASRVHFAPIIEELLKAGQRICYLTSAPSDPILTEQIPGLTSFYIGLGFSRTFLFSALWCKTLVMTMPDLHRYEIRRSLVHPVHYVYVFHTMVSTHMIYREGAFNHYDTILSVGPRHSREIRATEAHYRLPAKILIDHGYGRLDSLLKNVKFRGRHENAVVLIAPSYGKNSLLEVCGVELIRTLLAGGFQVICRPHPITTARSHTTMEAIRGEFLKNAGFRLETNVASEDSLHESDLMISDYSGAALEYAFGRLKPVLFIDVPKKVNNPNFEKIALTPIEVEIRSEVGGILNPNELSKACAVVRELFENSESYANRIRMIREGLVAHLGESGRIGCEAILDILKRQGPAPIHGQRSSAPIASKNAENSR